VVRKIAISKILQTYQKLRKKVTNKDMSGKIIFVSWENYDKSGKIFILSEKSDM
jgi:hypothetical protein